MRRMYARFADVWAILPGSTVRRKKTKWGGGRKKKNKKKQYFSQPTLLAVSSQ